MLSSNFKWPLNLHSAQNKIFHCSKQILEKISIFPSNDKHPWHEKVTCIVKSIFWFFDNFLSRKWITYDSLIHIQTNFASFDLFVINCFSRLTLSKICQSSEDMLDHTFLRTEMKDLFYPEPDQNRLQGKQFFPREECSKLLDEFSQVNIDPNFKRARFFFSGFGSK